MNVVCCLVEASAKFRAFVQRSPTQCGVSECDRGTSQWRPRPTRTVGSLKKDSLNRVIIKVTDCNYPMSIR